MQRVVITDEDFVKALGDNNVDGVLSYLAIHGSEPEKLRALVKQVKNDIYSAEIIRHLGIFNAFEPSFTFFGSDPEQIYKTVHTQTQSIREQLKQEGVRDSENIKLVFKFADRDKASLQNAMTFFSCNTDLLPANTTVKLIEDQTVFLRHKRV